MDARQKQEYHRLYAQRNRETIRHRKAQYYQENKDIYFARTNSIEGKTHRKVWYKRTLLERPWYWSWVAARNRCNLKTHERYPAYGGRGIKFLMTELEVEHLWYRDNADLMDRPTLDRIDNDGNYEVSNCRFIENIENLRKQHLSKAKNVLLSPIIKLLLYSFLLQKRVSKLRLKVKKEPY